MRRSIAIVTGLTALAVQMRRAAADGPTSTTDPGDTSTLPTPPPPPAAAAGAGDGSGSGSAPAKPIDLEAELAAGERVPDNPAIDLLGAEDLKVTKPGSLKDLQTDLRGLYKDGKIVPQIAIEFSPYDLTYGRSSTYDEYLRSSWTRFLHRATLSVATSSTGSDTSATTLAAVGLRIRIIDDTDWRLNSDAVACALKAVKLAQPPAHSAQPGVVVVPSDAAADKANADEVAACYKEHSAKWNATQLAVGGAVSSAFPQGQLKADINDVAGWAAYAHGVTDSAQVVLGGKYLFNSTYPKKHTGAATIQLEYRGPKYGSIFYGGAGYRWTKADPTMAWSSGFVGLVGGEFQVQVSDATWLALRFSAQIAPDNGDSFLSLANFKWSYDISHDKGK